MKKYEVSFHSDGGFAVWETTPAFGLQVSKRLLKGAEKQLWTEQMAKRMDQFWEHVK